MMADILSPTNKQTKNRNSYEQFRTEVVWFNSRKLNFNKFYLLDFNCCNLFYLLGEQFTFGFAAICFPVDRCYKCCTHTRPRPPNPHKKKTICILLSQIYFLLPIDPCVLFITQNFHNPSNFQIVVFQIVLKPFTCANPLFDYTFRIFILYCWHYLQFSNKRFIINNFFGK